MNEDTPQQDSVPGSGAGDAAPIQQIPHIPKPVTKPSVAPAKKSEAAASRQTDKGRTEPITRRVHTDPAIDAAAESLEKPLTAADYARTTKASAASTSVIPAVKDEPTDHAAPVEVDSSGRQASLRLNHIEPWSVTRIAFAVSVAMMIVGVVAVTIFWVVLSITGVWGQVNDSITSVLSDDSSSFNITDYLGFWRLVGLTLVLSAINVVLMTALATIAAHLYNLAAQLLGGVEVTFGEDN
ncbi:MAG: hypothetical protein JWQ70_2699 [Aeromicrobium sp.]|nr:hypothetical protein [Aeromicrobium sp.]